MAIIEEFGLEVKVKVNGSVAAEYPDEEPDIDGDAWGPATKISYHYVESIDNAEFAIHVGVPSGSNAGQKWIRHSRKHALTFWLAFDGGRDAARKTIHQRSNSFLLEGVHNWARTTMRKFRFAPVSTVDDDDKTRVATDMKVAQDLGLIRVSVYRTIIENEIKTRSSPHPVPNLAADTICLAEKAVKGKAVSHGTALSAPIGLTKKRLHSIKYIDQCASPLAVFYFKYRSKEALQQQLVIRRPRSLSMESDMGNLSPDEIRRLARERLSQIRRGKKRAATVKNEDDAEVPQSEKPFKFVRIEGGKKAIDLTEDD
ncbi:hypothetical protein J7T55_006293 [Diaporthe amygdali]|uniref:uncharacterized protein n=1 Tax=Phomopsis amygdali TaxID=1214568 RepID=UPI0022FEFBB9|nr:uncharacterized protein J7T55_006293 [Diaporthe amygdali]KAJ0124950.1 hypothetical protein J7T55_006293 [Diaporthe amygdali]